MNGYLAKEMPMITREEALSEIKYCFGKLQMLKRIIPALEREGNLDGLKEARNEEIALRMKIEEVNNALYKKEQK